MAKRLIKGLAELRTLVGETLGASDWLTIDQDRVAMFADATGDQQWIHTDPEKARQFSPYGTTIAHGFLTLSLCPTLAQDIMEIEGIKMGVNYGLNRVRFPNAVKVGARIRLVSQLVDLKDTQGGVTATYKQTIEIEGEEKPACVAEMMARLYF